MSVECGFQSTAFSETPSFAVSVHRFDGMASPFGDARWDWRDQDDSLATAAQSLLAPCGSSATGRQFRDVLAFPPGAWTDRPE
jgi:hypothetical protein